MPPGFTIQSSRDRIASPLTIIQIFDLHNTHFPTTVESYAIWSPQVSYNPHWAHLPKAHTSDLLLNFACVITSGAAYLILYFVPSVAMYILIIQNKLSQMKTTYFDHIVLIIIGWARPSFLKYKGGDTGPLLL